MTQQRHCAIYRTTDFLWYLELGNFEHADSTFSTTYGPFRFLQDVHEERQWHSNPGGHELSFEPTSRPPIRGADGGPIVPPSTPYFAPNGPADIILAQDELWYIHPEAHKLALEPSGPYPDLSTVLAIARQEGLDWRTIDASGSIQPPKSGSVRPIALDDGRLHWGSELAEQRQWKALADTQKTQEAPPVARPRD